jgi:hypothetical protein
MFLLERQQDALSLILEDTRERERVAWFNMIYLINGIQYYSWWYGYSMMWFYIYMHTLMVIHDSMITTIFCTCIGEWEMMWWFMIQGLSCHMTSHHFKPIFRFNLFFGTNLIDDYYILWLQSIVVLFQPGELLWCIPISGAKHVDDSIRALNDHFLREPPSSKHWNFWKCWCVEPSRQKRSTKRSTSNSARTRRSQPCRR